MTFHVEAGTLVDELIDNGRHEMKTNSCLQAGFFAAAMIFGRVPLPPGRPGPLSNNPNSSRRLNLLHSCKPNHWVSPHAA
jgi:hypothetical protein